MSKPCLGYPSRTAAVHGLRAQGYKDSEIARRIGISQQTVAALAAYRKRQRKRSEVERTVVVPIVVLDRLASAANIRGISVNELVRRIVETVADEGIVDAVLDDREAAE